MFSKQCNMILCFSEFSLVLTFLRGSNPTDPGNTETVQLHSHHSWCYSFWKGMMHHLSAPPLPPLPPNPLHTHCIHTFLHCIHSFQGVLPRVAALLDVANLSDVTAIESDDTFERGIYAGMCEITL